VGSLSLAKRRPAGIQYMGLPGISSSCKRAVERLIQAGEKINSVMLLTAGGAHVLLLELDELETIAVKSGFRSGYAGEGPRTLAETLLLLQAFRVEIEEVEVEPGLIDRLDESALTVGDLENLRQARPVRPVRWHEYCGPTGVGDNARTEAVRGLPAAMPWGLLDARLVALAMDFETNPDHALFSGFRQLEDLVRQRIGQEPGAVRVLADAFVGDRSVLTWDKLPAGEHSARGQLFTSAYGAFRNPRAHRLVAQGSNELLQEFLTLNLLYTLERTAVKRPQDSPGEAAAPSQQKTMKGHTP
jgi:hypothetical protein